MDSTSFSGFKWVDLTGLERGNELQQHAAQFLKTIRWDAVRYAASDLRNHRACELDSSIGLGGRHMIRVLRFEDGVNWIARLRMTSENYSVVQEAERMWREIDCLNFVKQKSTLPVPAVYGHNTREPTRIGAPTMFMECFLGNVAMDLNFNTIPLEYKPSFLREMARIQLPKIGTILQQDDGSFTVGPIPNLGGPFATATEFFEAWAAKTTFPHSAARIQDICGPFGDEILASIEAFPPKIRRLAQRLSPCDGGPFPLCHGDFGHNNIVVDDHYRVLGVIDWEDAYTAPWETLEFPLILYGIPRSIDLPDNYDAEGNPKTKVHPAKGQIPAYQQPLEPIIGAASMLPTDIAQPLIKGTDLSLACLRLRILDAHGGVRHGVCQPRGDRSFDNLGAGGARCPHYRVGARRMSGKPASR